LITGTIAAGARHSPVFESQPYGQLVPLSVAFAVAGLIGKGTVTLLIGTEPGVYAVVMGNLIFA
jgi:hypothetical protein